jgi:nucleotide-binding universal stress UspA family protein
MPPIIKGTIEFKRILCAVDFSTDSLAAFKVAVEMARLHGGSLHIFHVIEAQPVVPPQVEIRIVEEANAAMKSLVASAKSSLNGLPFTTEVTSGGPFVEIIERAREWRANLIVLGSKGITSLEEIIIGGTAENVMKEAPCSVLVVRPENKHHRSAVRE